MDRDHKYSGTLPLLAYAPQDFGLNAQRSRAYRARVAMGRAGVQPLRSQVQAPVITVKTQAAEALSEAKPSLFAKLWRRASLLFSKPQMAETVSQAATLAAVVKRKTVTSVVQESSVSRPHVLIRKPVEHNSIAEQNSAVEKIVVQENPVNDVTVSEPFQPVSKTYAAMRMSNVAVVANDQTIPQAPDLAHALAEIRQALREHEKLANAKQRDMSL